MNPSPDTIEQVIERDDIGWLRKLALGHSPGVSERLRQIADLLEALSRNREPTEAMIEAGARELCQGSPLETAHDAVRDIYLAMERARTKGVA